MFGFQRTRTRRRSRTTVLLTRTTLLLCLIWASSSFAYDTVHIPKQVHHVELKIDSQGLPHYTPPPQVLANFLSDIKATQHPIDQNHDNLHKIPKRALKNYFIFTYHQTVPEDVQRAFEYAGRIVSVYFENLLMDLRVVVDWRELGREVLAHAGPTAFYKVASQSNPRKFVWLPKSLMNQRVAISPPDADSADMIITVNSQGAWYTGIDGQVPEGHYDLVTVVIHEIQHGLGFLSMVGQRDHINGAKRLSQSPLEDPYIFDSFVHIAGKGPITDYFPNTMDAQEQNTIILDSTTELVWNSSSFEEPFLPKLYVPALFDGSSSISHLDEATYPAGSYSSLMTPILAKQEVIHNLGGELVTIYKDMGYQMRHCTRYTTCGSCVANLCRWCFDANGGECGDPGAFPYFNAECKRTNSTFKEDDLFCLPDDSDEPFQGTQHENAAGTYEIVVAKATNECFGAMDCFFLHYQPDMLIKIMKLVLVVSCVSLLIIYY